MPGGRPTKLTPEVELVILDAIEKGNYRATAAALAGVHRNTLLAWERWGEEGKEPYAEFVCAVQRAEARAESELLERVKIADPGWQGSAWLLERRWAHRWSQRVRTVVAEEVASLTETVRKSLDPETYSKVVDAVTKEPGERPGNSAH